MILIIVMVLGLVRGYHIGFVRQMGSTIGFLCGMLLSAWLIPLTTPHLVGATSKTMTTFLLLVGSIVVCMLAGEFATNFIKSRLKNTWAHQIDIVGGSIVSGITLLFIAWLASSFWLFGPPSKWQDRIQDSFIYASMSARLPEPTAILKRVDTLVEPTKTNEVFTTSEPSPIAKYPKPSLDTFSSIRARTTRSLVKVQGLGCGGIATGTGFFIQPNLVATNAHVIAGVTNPKIIMRDGHLYNAQPVLFNPAYDFVILRVSRSVVAEPLQVDFTNPQNGTPLFIPGYPGGGPYKEKTGVLTETIIAASKDIYGKAAANRKVLSMQSHIEHGNSGGPVLDRKGNVVGVVFATSTTYNNIGYALANEQLAKEFLRAPTAQPIAIPNTCSQE